MCLVSTLDLKKRAEYITYNERDELREVHKVFSKACKRYYRMIKRRKLTYGKHFDYVKIVGCPASNYLVKCTQMLNDLNYAITTKSHNCLETDYALHELFIQHSANQDSIDNLELSLDEIKEIHKTYKALEHNNSHNLEMLEEVINQYTDEVYLIYSWL